MRTNDASRTTYAWRAAARGPRLRYLESLQEAAYSLFSCIRLSGSHVFRKHDHKRLAYRGGFREALEVDSHGLIDFLPLGRQKLALAGLNVLHQDHAIPKVSDPDRCDFIFHALAQRGDQRGKNLLIVLVPPFLQQCNRFYLPNGHLSMLLRVDDTGRNVCMFS